EVFEGIDSDKRAGWTVLFTGIPLAARAFRIKRSGFTEVALDCYEVIRCRRRDWFGWFQTQGSHQLLDKAKTWWFRLPGNHGYRVVRALRRAVKTSNTG